MSHGDTAAVAAAEATTASAAVSSGFESRFSWQGSELSLRLSTDRLTQDPLIDRRG